MKSESEIRAVVDSLERKLREAVVREDRVEAFRLGYAIKALRWVLGEKIINLGA